MTDSIDTMTPTGRATADAAAAPGGGSPVRYPGRWAYTWVSSWPGQATVQPLPGGPDVEDGMGRVDAAKWAAALAALPAPGPVAVSERHVHTAACWGDEIITDSIEGPGRVCEDTARYPTSYSDEGVLGRWDRWVWYPLAIVERYWDGVS